MGPSASRSSLQEGNGHGRNTSEIREQIDAVLGSTRGWVRARMISVGVCVSLRARGVCRLSIDRQLSPASMGLALGISVPSRRACLIASMVLETTLTNARTVPAYLGAVTFSKAHNESTGVAVMAASSSSQRLDRVKRQT